MSATGLEVFDRTLQVTNTWLDEMMETLPRDRKLAWHVLAAVLRTIRDRVPINLAAHLGAQLPLLVRGTYYDNVLTFEMHMPTWPFFAVAWAGDGAAVLLIAIRTYRLIFHPEDIHDAKVKTVE